VIVIVLALAGHVSQLFLGSVQNWLAFALATPFTSCAGWPLSVRGIASVRQRSSNVYTVVALVASAAYLCAVAATLVPQSFPTTFMQ
ncbi:copper-transporting ATPase, partial [Pseudomonas fluorescens]